MRVSAACAIAAFLRVLMLSAASFETASDIRRTALYSLRSPSQAQIPETGCAASRPCRVTIACAKGGPPQKQYWTEFVVPASLSKLSPAPLPERRNEQNFSAFPRLRLKLEQKGVFRALSGLVRVQSAFVVCHEYSPP
jgi:hypothetical protein